jgi:ribosomal 50S subunit-associated protein YjgA (DUF615 family)
MEKHIESTELWFLRRMIRIPWTAKKTNTEILIEANEQRHIIVDLRRRQAKFIGHVLRKGKLEDIVTTETVSGKRVRGRQRVTIFKSKTKWLRMKTETKLISLSRNRQLWRGVAANAYSHGI